MAYEPPARPRPHSPDTTDNVPAAAAGNEGSVALELPGVRPDEQPLSSASAKSDFAVQQHGKPVAVPAAPKFSTSTRTSQKPPFSVLGGGEQSLPPTSTSTASAPQEWATDPLGDSVKRCPAEQTSQPVPGYAIPGQTEEVSIPFGSMSNETDPTDKLLLASVEHSGTRNEDPIPAPAQSQIATHKNQAAAQVFQLAAIDVQRAVKGLLDTPTEGMDAAWPSPVDAMAAQRDMALAALAVRTEERNQALWTLSDLRRRLKQMQSADPDSPFVPSSSRPAVAASSSQGGRVEDMDDRTADDVVLPTVQLFSPAPSEARAPAEASAMFQRSIAEYIQAKSNEHRNTSDSVSIHISDYNSVLAALESAEVAQILRAHASTLVEEANALPLNCIRTAEDRCASGDVDCNAHEVCIKRFLAGRYASAAFDIWTQRSRLTHSAGSGATEIAARGKPVCWRCGCGTGRPSTAFLASRRRRLLTAAPSASLGLWAGRCNMSMSALPKVWEKLRNIL